jgi:aminopeptidase N
MTNLNARYLADYKTPSFTISTVDLTFELSEKTTRVTSVLSIANSLAKGEQSSGLLVLDGEQMLLESVQLNNVILTEQDYQLTDTQLSISTSEQNFTLTIVTEINPLDNTSLEGLFKSGQAFCSQCEAEGFRRITYFLDRPDVMAIYTCQIIADKTQYPYLLSNGNKVDAGDLADGKHFVKWHDPFPKPCYLFALVAGDFDLLQDHFKTQSGRDVALEIFVDKGNLHKAKHAMISLQKSMRWDEETFNLEYDLDIYMIVAVDFFNMGAMENKGLNVFNSKYVLADSTSATDTDYFGIEAVIAHEYFHNWTGNRVTCRDWFQLSLKEGLTVFRDQQFSADMHSKTVTRIQNVRHLRSMQFAEDAGPMSHPIRPEKVMEMNNFYTLTVYEKGAEVIRMLYTLLGEQGFKAGMALYFSRFDGMAVTCEDFVDAMADASQVDLTQFKHWYSQSGTPLLTVKHHYNTQTQEFMVTIKQGLATAGSTSPLHIPINIELIESDFVEGDVQTKAPSSQSHLLELTQSEQTWTFKGFTEKPILAFLGDFSAPVKVDYQQSDNDLAVIMSTALDGFCRWDAGQKLLTNYIKALTHDADYALPKLLIDIFSQLLTHTTDHAFMAEQLILPSFDEVAELIEQVDPSALLLALDTVKSFLANGLQQQLLATYQQCEHALTEHSKNGSTEDGVANRALKNICLSYLSLLPEQQYLVDLQYQSSDNMTDTLAALHSSASNDLAAFELQMEVFEQKWSTTPLVMDKWFMINACLVSDDIFNRLERLLNHPLFSLKNPNRARSLISAFTANNPKYFHCASGRGYQFLSEQVARLNALNPQVASRLITPLIQFKGFEPNRQQLMKAQLHSLRKLPDLSKDLLEKLDAALNDNVS